MKAAARLRAGTSSARWWCWRQADLKFECSKHDSVYTVDGTYVGGRATRNMDRFVIKRSGNTVIVNVAQTIESDVQKAAWDAAVVSL